MERESVREGLEASEWLREGVCVRGLGEGGCSSNQTWSGLLYRTLTWSVFRTMKRGTTCTAQQRGTPATGTSRTATRKAAQGSPPATADEEEDGEEPLPLWASETPPFWACEIEGRGERRKGGGERREEKGVTRLLLRLSKGLSSKRNQYDS